MRDVIVKFKAFKEMIKYFAQYSSNKIPKGEWVESMGFLFCSVEGDYYIVEDAIGMTSGSELDVQLSPQSLANINQMEQEHDGDFIGGWWHTHPGLTPFFSETDIKNQVFYQTANEDGLGIVFDHSIIDEDFIGFQIFRLIHQFSEEYIEVPYQLQGFTKEGIKECMNLLKIDSGITKILMEKYGGKGASIRIDFTKLGEPLVDDPLDDSEWIKMEANELIKEDKTVEAIKKYKLAAIILSESDHHEIYAETLYSLVKLCYNHKFNENAKEEYQLFKNLKGTFDNDKFDKLDRAINHLLTNI